VRACLRLTPAALFAARAAVFVMKEYWQSLLALRWRAWLTRRYLRRYTTGAAFYALNAAGEVDNPDQRVNADVGAFTGTALGLALTLFSSVVDLASFSGILYSIYPPLFAVLLAYAAGGSAVSVALGGRLVGLNFMQEAREADFRFALVRLRENAESVAFYDPDARAEGRLLAARFGAALDNARASLLASRNLGAFTSFYRFLISFLPAAVVAPLYFRHQIEFGVISQSSSAFNHILSDVSLLVYQFEALAGFAATTQRIGQFDESLDAAAAAAAGGGVERAALRSDDDPGLLLRLSGLTLAPPRWDASADGPPPPLLLRDLSLELRAGEDLLVMGRSGAGKTSLLRAVAGLWRQGRGRVELPAVTSGSASVLYLPQKPYIVLGTLRQQLLYPLWAGDWDAQASGDSDAAAAAVAQQPPPPPPPSDAQLAAALSAVSLSHLTSRGVGGGMDDSGIDWASTLSLGEQQRLSFARALLARPALALLDEATSALDSEAEARCYAALRAAGATALSVGHRDSLMAFHSRVLTLGLGDAGDGFELARAGGRAEAATRAGRERA